MVSRLPLPISPAVLHEWSALTPPARILRVERSGPVLHASPLGKDGEVLSLNLARGCGHGCAFCPARAYPTYPGDGLVLLYERTAERLDDELARRRVRPRAVFVSPSTDPFMAPDEVRAESVRVVEVLARHNVEAWLMTRGAIDPVASEALASHRDHVKLTVAITTSDRRIQSVLEPAAAPPRVRVRQVAELRKRGVRVSVALDPLLPRLTDTRDNLSPLLDALAAAGVRHVTASYAFLRTGIEDNLARALEGAGYDGSVLAAYAGGPILAGPGLAAARYLPKARRQRGYAALMTLAANFGMTVGVCPTTNPDFFTATTPQAPAARPTLLARFLQASAV